MTASVRIDLRSDTLTKPSPAMREAMARAEVGDDVYREDPTVRRLEERAAEIFGREAALLVPSGTMGNLIAIACHARRGQEAICERRAHVYDWEIGSMAAIAGVMPRVVDGDRGLMSWTAIAKEIQPRQDHRADTALVCIENTHNMGGGTVWPTALVEEVCKGAKGRGVRVHIDGARIFNAATALGEEVADMTRSADSVMFCLSKGLGAPIGSMLVGSRAFVEDARRWRKMLGGGMRQAGTIAAAGLVALEEGPPLLARDHANARRLAEAVAGLPRLVAEPARVQTNIVMAGVEPAGPGDVAPALAFVGRLVREGLLCSPIGTDRIRFVTHRDASDADIDRAIEVLAKVANA